MENTLKLEKTFNHIDHPFSITFTHKHESIQITLQDNSDIFKLGEHYKGLLDDLNIKYIVGYKNDNINLNK
jgi:predicted ferric reductase